MSLSPTMGVTTQGSELQLAGRSRCGSSSQNEQFPATFWVKSKTYRPRFLLHSQGVCANKGMVQTSRLHRGSEGTGTVSRNCAPQGAGEPTDKESRGSDGRQTRASESDCLPTSCAT